MGGLGSGRWGFHTKRDTVEDCLSIDINWCIRKGFINPGHWSLGTLSWSGRYCGKRVGKIYSAPGSRYFGCRHCQDLTYTSCQEHDKRIDALVNNPEMLLAMLDSNDTNVSILALKAYYKVTGRL